jgi:hypothetical protein
MLFYFISSNIRLEGSDTLSTLLPTAANIALPPGPSEKRGRRTRGRPSPRLLPLECVQVYLLCAALEVEEEKSAPLQGLRVLADYDVLKVVGSALAAPDTITEAAPGDPAGGSVLLGGGYDVSVTINGDFLDWSLGPIGSLSTKDGTLTIDVPGAGNKWAVTPSSDSATGQLTEYEDPNYVPDPKKITKSLQVRAVGGNTVDLAKGGLLISGQGDATIPFSFEQQTSWFDQPLPAGRVYRIIVTFTGSKMA